MKNIIIINGYPHSGKDNFVEYCKAYAKIFNIKVYNISTVDKIKKIAKKLGWDGKKDDIGRKFLSELKRISIEYNDGPFVYTINKINKKIKNNSLFFVHCREASEIEKFKEYYKDNILTLYLDKDVYIPDNESDKNVKNYKYDVYINANVSKIELFELAKDFILKIQNDDF